MEKYNILFRGYRRDCNRAGLPTYSGIYIVYRCTFNQEKQTVSLKELLYIGQAQNIRDRISGHDKREKSSLMQQKKVNRFVTLMQKWTNKIWIL